MDLETQAKLESAAMMASQTRERARNNKKGGQVFYENVRFILDVSSHKSCTFSVVFFSSVYLHLFQFVKVSVILFYSVETIDRRKLRFYVNLLKIIKFVQFGAGREQHS